jgi:hypothetical protein
MSSNSIVYIVRLCQFLHSKTVNADFAPSATTELDSGSRTWGPEFA